MINMIRILFLLMLLFLCGCGNNHNKETAEMNQKPIWADLQGIEFRNRDNNNLLTPTLFKGAIGEKGYAVLVISLNRNTTSLPSFRHVWIIINVNAGINGIYMMPHEIPQEKDLHLLLPCKFLSSLKKTEKLDPVVSDFLELHCANTP